MVSNRPRAYVYTMDGMPIDWGSDPVEEMFWPVQCIPCGHIHDAGKVEVVARYTDCSMWRCPRCNVLLDDRPRGWGGNTRKIEKR